MIAPPIPRNESERLTALKRYQILDTEPEKNFDDLTFLASHICGTPIALITLVDDKRQWFKSRCGIEAEETARDVSFCGHAILENKLFVVPDTLGDDRFSDNPLVTGDPRIRFYAGAPLLTYDGHALGTLCIIDRAPKVLTWQQKGALEALARQTAALLDYRLTLIALKEAESTLKHLTGLLPICAWCKNMRT